MAIILHPLWRGSVRHYPDKDQACRRSRARVRACDSMCVHFALARHARRSRRSIFAASDRPCLCARPRQDLHTLFVNVLDGRGRMTVSKRCTFVQKTSLAKFKPESQATIAPTSSSPAARTGPCCVPGLPSFDCAPPSTRGIHLVCPAHPPQAAGSRRAAARPLRTRGPPPPPSSGLPTPRYSHADCGRRGCSSHRPRSRPAPRRG